MMHQLHNNVASTSHNIIIHLVGVGGTGSHVLTNLAMISKALVQIERPPLFVMAVDHDHVEPSNIGRQAFSEADIGHNKAKVMIERVNRYFGLQWEYMDSNYAGWTSHNMPPDFTISCVDSIESRKIVQQSYERRPSGRYWMDIGNDQRKAQIILGLKGDYIKEDRPSTILPHFFEEYGDIEDDPNDLTPSCSAMESLNRQDLFVNKIIASYATHMLWQLLKDFQIDYRGMYINLESMNINKIQIK